jgi:8-oxo-dGTP diphosphatase
MTDQTQYEPIAVTAAVIFRSGTVFLARREQNSSLGGYWEFPGGKMHVGETPQHCLERELYEEFRIRTRAGAIIAENFHHYPDKTIHLLALNTSILSGTPEKTVHDQLAFVPLDELLDYKLAPADLPIAVKILSLYRETGVWPLF